MCECACIGLGTRETHARSPNQLANWKWCEPNLCVVNLILFMVWLVFDRFVSAIARRHCCSVGATVGWLRVEPKRNCQLNTKFESWNFCRLRSFVHKRAKKAMQINWIAPSVVRFTVGQWIIGYCVRILAFERAGGFRVSNRKENWLHYFMAFMKVALPVSIRDQWERPNEWLKVEHDIRAALPAALDRNRILPAIESNAIFCFIAPHNVFSISINCRYAEWSFY